MTKKNGKERVQPVLPAAFSFSKLAVKKRPSLVGTMGSTSKAGDIEHLRGKIAQFDKVEASTISAQGLISTTEGFQSHGTGPARLELGGADAKWAIGTRGQILYFQQFHNGRWFDRQTLTSTGFTGIAQVSRE